MPFGTQLSLGAGDIVLDGDPALLPKGAQPPILPFGKNRHGPKCGGGAAVPLLGDLDPNVTQCGWAKAYLHTKWHVDPSTRTVPSMFGHNRHKWSK